MGITTTGTNGSWDQPHNHFLETEPSVLKATKGAKHPSGEGENTGARDLAER